MSRTVPVVAELKIHHSPRPSATRRVSPDPLRFSALGGPDAARFLVAAIVGWNVPLLDDDDRDNLEELFADLETRPRPPRALKHRVQHDSVGLDTSLHRLVATSSGWRVVIDEHGPAAPQVVGALVALEALGDDDRVRAIDLAETAVDFPGGTVADLMVFLQAHGSSERHIDSVESGASAWALRLLGIDAVFADVTESDVLRAYRRMVRVAHPDHGAPAEGAADRLDELKRAKSILVGSPAPEDPARGRYAQRP